MNIDKINIKIKEKNLNSIIVEDLGDSVKFKSQIIEKKYKVLRRLSNINYLKYFDQIYNTNIDEKLKIEKKLKSLACSKGGIANQKKNYEQIQQNLHKNPPWNKGTKGLTVGWAAGKNKFNNKQMFELSESRKGTGNPMFGKKLSNNTKEKLSTIMKEKILNGEFTPNIKNSNTHWQVKYNNKVYRSSWEALFHKFNNNYEYEKLRLPYFYENKKKIYIVDFICYQLKHIVEIKPKSHTTSKIQVAKEIALQEFCQCNGYTYDVYDEEWFRNNFSLSDITDFDDTTQSKLRSLFK